ncbi:hypothetical protein D3C87_1816120 [compost metagenome]
MDILEMIVQCIEEQLLGYPAAIRQHGSVCTILDLIGILQRQGFNRVHFSSF